MNILGIDLGGTHTRHIMRDTTAALNPPPGKQINKEFNHSDALLRHVLDVQPQMPDVLSIAVAGPIKTQGDTQVCELTNLPWRLDSSEIAKRFGIKRVLLLNDFAALAYALACPERLNRVALWPGIPDPKAPRLVLGPGTGLGAAIVVSTPPTLQVIATEAGHCDFAPTSDEDLRLWHFLKKNHLPFGWESLVSGPGLERIYTFLDPTTATAVSTASLVDQALKQPGLARAALDLMLRLLGNFARNLSLACLPRGGIYLAGGLLPRLFPQYGMTQFLEACHQQTAHHALIRSIPIELIQDDHAGALGAIEYACQELTTQH